VAQGGATLPQHRHTAESPTTASTISTLPSSALPATAITKPSTITMPTNVMEQIQRYFPPLQQCVIDNVELPGLNADEFFDVFFSDSAPYSMRDFQTKRGDVDIRYGKWEDVRSEGDSHSSHIHVESARDNLSQSLHSFKKTSNPTSNPTPIPANSTRQRILKFNTLTKSYFGPAYAKACKTQRATRLFGGRVLVIENVTQLGDIPFSDRFRVMERWVVEAVENSPKQNRTARRYNDGNDAQYTCKLSVHAEVEMLKSCSWEAQIRKKASETFTEVLKEWCKSATVALKATEEQKRKRLRTVMENEDLSSSQLPRHPTNSTTRQQQQHPPIMPQSPSDPNSSLPRQSQLFAKHRRNFQELDKLIAKGDLEWCSIEVLHSPSSSSSTNAAVLDHHVADVTARAALSVGEGTVPISDVDSSESSSEGSSSSDRLVKSETAGVMMKRKSRRLFRRISSRVTKSKMPPLQP